MTKNQFIALCKEHSIDPCIALENESITKALGIAMDTNVLVKAKITLILEEEF